MTIIKRALISVSDKKGIVDFARGLKKFNIEILSTGGTAKLLADNGIAVIEVGDFGDRQARIGQQFRGAAG